MTATTSAAPTDRPGVRRWLRRPLATLAAVVVTASGLVALATSASAEVVVRPSDGVLRVKGHGFGHGRGMSQYGARGAAEKGLTYKQILDFYYPGTSLGSLADSSITVRATGDTDGITQVAAQSGLQLSSGSNATARTLPTNIGATSWRTSTTSNGTTATLQYHVQSGGVWTWKDYDLLGNGGTLTPPVTFSNSSSGRVRLLLGSYYREYIGSVIAARYNGTHYSVVKTTMETYLRGVVPSEMPASWSTEAVKAQSVAARTYAANQRASSPSGRPYQTCDSTSCQVFHGYADYDTSGALLTARTNSLSDAAIKATAGVTVMYGGKPAFTEFSASNGGYSVAGDVPYLVAKKDPYDGLNNPVHDWTASVTVATIEKAHPSIGRLASLHVVRDGNGDWGGRPDTITLVGSTGSETISGSQFSSEAGFRHRWWALLEPQDVTPAPRLSGSDRYETAAAVAAKFPADSVAYIASGESFPDALAGAARAGSLGGPVLLTAPKGLPAATVKALTRLAPSQIVVLGGTTAVSDTVVTQLKPLTPGAVTRIQGADRYATAAKISSSFPRGVPTVYVASGADFPDALAGAAVAAAGGEPVLLTKATSLPTATAQAITALAPGKIVILGGTGAVSAAVETQLRGLGAATVSRVSGSDRYQTAALVSALLPTATSAYVASGTTFPDALAGAALAGHLGAPVLLTAPTSLPGVTGSALTTMRPNEIYVLGGPSAVSTVVAGQLGAYLVAP